MHNQVNLTQLCVARETPYLLLEFQEYKDKMLQDLAYRREIIEYVLSKLNHRYMMLENVTKIPCMASDIFPECLIHERTAILQLSQTKILDLVHSYLTKLEQTEFLTELTMLEEQR